MVLSEKINMIMIGRIFPVHCQMCPWGLLILIAGLISFASFI